MLNAHHCAIHLDHRTMWYILFIIYMIYIILRIHFSWIQNIALITKDNKMFVKGKMMMYSSTQTPRNGKLPWVGETELVEKRKFLGPGIVRASCEKHKIKNTLRLSGSKYHWTGWEYKRTIPHINTQRHCPFVYLSFKIILSGHVSRERSKKSLDTFL